MLVLALWWREKPFAFAETNKNREVKTFLICQSHNLVTVPTKILAQTKINLWQHSCSRKFGPDYVSFDTLLSHIDHKIDNSSLHESHATNLIYLGLPFRLKYVRDYVQNLLANSKFTLASRNAVVTVL